VIFNIVLASEEWINKETGTSRDAIRAVIYSKR